MPESGITYSPPAGYPLGTNRAFRICSRIVIPVLLLFTERDWRGGENIPRSGPAIVVSNHVSYSDVLFLAQFLYLNGRAPRFIGKRSLFNTPILGRIIAAAGQIPVDRESGDASQALDHAVAALKAGHLVGVYPEGTLTRDENLWPMVAKTGIARLAILSQAPVIPVAIWGTQQVLARYSKRPHFWPRTTVICRAGGPIDLSPWYGKSDDHEALVEATAYVMRTLTTMIEGIRQESAPAQPFDTQKSNLPRTGNFNKEQKKQRKNK